MDSVKFDGVARLVSRGQTRRETVRGLLAGAVALGAAVAGLDQASAKPRRRPRRQVCKRAGAFCQSNKQCCPGKTKRICAVSSQAGNSDKTCCGGQGAVCGGANVDGDALKPHCCAGFVCSSTTSARGICQRVPEDV
jgi:hypothetical protein